MLGETVLRRPPSRKAAPREHDRKKRYLLEEGTPVPFLVELGVMTPDGKVRKSRYDKFRQVNRFLELVDDVVPSLRPDGTLRVVDFGCGKSYLTFAIHHLLTELRGRSVEIVGLDLKEDVIAACASFAERSGAAGLRFERGDIASFEAEEGVDLVVSLHACDTATDEALAQAVRWQADAILAVPCCQKEAYRQLESELLAPLLRHGLAKERFAALVTDTLRAQLLELAGYRAQLVEFVSARAHREERPHPRGQGRACRRGCTPGLRGAARLARPRPCARTPARLGAVAPASVVIIQEMAYDETLAARIRELVSDEPGLTEKKMFGGLAFLIGGNMAVAASGQGGILVRVDPDESDALVEKTNAHHMVMRGKPMRGWLRVDPEDLRAGGELAGWVEVGVTRARSLPEKR